ncbi:MAG TPA: alpha/beta hydrolase [Noviherbaspirillum sp.]|nr:alpha/beta hydrolase [Noviherbaspirillum sp.]
MPAPADNKQRRIILAMVMLAAARPAAFAQPLRGRLAARRGDDELDGGDDDSVQESALLNAGVQVVRDVAYGRDDDQRFDVYLPRSGTRNAPVIFMAHGGGWYRGDKAMRAVVDNKVAHWVPKGYVFISTNYRMLPQAAPVEQAEDIARAIIFAQRNAASWGGDPSKFILMGHSAGAHLVALVSAAPVRAQRQGALPWLGSILLDSASLDVVTTMEGRHLSLHDRAFGSDPAYWRQASPYHHLTSNTAPMLAVCSTERKSACPQAHSFTAKAVSLGVPAQVLEQALSHREINEQLGKPGRYTDAVDAFIASLISR